MEESPTAASPFSCFPGLRALAALAVCLGLGGCQTLTPTRETEPLRDIASFYWPYAALATNVYDSKGQIEPELSLALASPWLRAAVNQAVRTKGPQDSISPQVEDYEEAMQARYFRDGFDRQCARMKRRPAGTEDKATAIIRKLCAKLAEADLPRSDDPEDTRIFDNAHVNRAPMSVDDCSFKDKKPPSVDLADAIREFKWQRVPEFQKYALARGWRLFVPELAIDVWRRTRSEPGADL
jgi:hypothetical protein